MAEQTEITGPGRKFWIAVIYSVSLLAVLVYMVERPRDKFTGEMFFAWLGAFAVSVISYVMGNVAVAGAAAKAAAPSSSTTSTSTSTETKIGGAA